MGGRGRRGPGTRGEGEFYFSFYMSFETIFTYFITCTYYLSNKVARKKPEKCVPLLSDSCKDGQLAVPTCVPVVQRSSRIMAASHL